MFSLWRCPSLSGSSCQSWSLEHHTIQAQAAQAGGEGRGLWGAWCLLSSLLSPAPSSLRALRGSAGRRATGALQRLLRPSAGGRGWLETCGRPGQAGGLAPLHEDIPSLVQSGFRREDRGSVGVGREELLGPPLAPLAFPVGLCSPLSTAKALLFSPPHSLVTRAFLAVKGAHLCPKWLVK